MSDSDFWGFLVLAALVALIFNGWPKFFTIHIHKHYHGKGEDKP